MAIKGTEVIEDNHLDNAIKQAKELLKVFEQLNVQVLKNVKDLKKVTIKGGTQSAKQIKELTGALSESELKKRAVLKIDKERQKLEIQLKALNSEKIKQNDVLKRQVQDQTKFNKQLAEDARKLVGTEEKLIASNKKLLAERKKLDTSTKQGSKRLKTLNAELDRNNKVLEKNSDKLGKQRIGIGRYSKAIGGLRSGLARLGLAFGVFSLIKDSFNVIKNFDQAQADLSSVLGVTRDEMSALTEQSKELGATTEFTATQVAELQKEFAKLGFTQEEIENVTEATLQLASAAGTDLANAATITGSTLRAFGLDSSETQRVVDVMAKSFSSSSLDIEKFKVAMAAVAPVAKAMGFTIEETTALIGTLTDQGIDASTAGTGLRNMFLDSKKAGLTFQEALDKIANSSDKVGTAFDLFGKRGATLGVILAENQAATASLGVTLENAGGAAEEMADKQLDTLGGAIKLLQSAWEGLILKFNEGSGASEFLKNVIKFLAENLVEIVAVIIKVTAVFGAYKIGMKAATLATKLFGEAGKKASKFFGGPMLAAVAAVVFIVMDLIDAFRNAWKEGKRLEETNKKVTEAMAQERAEMDLLFRALAKTTNGTKAREKALDDINAKYGLTLQNLSDEQAFVAQLAAAYEKLVIQLRKRIGLQVVEEELVQAIKDLRSLENEIEELGGKETFLGAAFFEQIPKARQDIRDLENELIRLQQTGEQVGVGKGKRGFNGELEDAEENIDDVNKELEKTLSLLERLKKEGFKIIEDPSELIEGEVFKEDKKADFDQFVKSLQDETNALELELRNRNASEEEIRKALDDKEIEDLKRKAEFSKQLFGENSSEFLAADLAVRQEIDKRNNQQEQDEIDARERKKKAEKKERDDRLKELKRLRDESIKIVKEITDDLITNIDRRIDARQSEIDASTSEISRLEALKAEGNVEAAESLKVEKIAIAREKLEIERLQKKKRNILITVVALERASQLIGSGDGNPFKNAGAGLSDFLASLPTASEGTDYNVAQTFGKANKSGQDGYLGWVDGSEKILSIDNSKKLGGMHQDEITRRALAYNNNLVSTRALNVKEIQSMTDANIVKELQANTEAIKNIRIVQQHIDLATGQEVIRDGNKITRNNHKPTTFRI